MSFALKVNEPKSEDLGDLSRPFGTGFNALLEAGWTWTEDLQCEKFQQRFSDLVKEIDHQHLGFDRPELQISTPETLVKYCAETLGASIVRLKRGDDIAYEFKKD